VKFGPVLCVSGATRRTRHHTTGPNFTLPNTDYAHKTSQEIFGGAHLILLEDGSQRIRSMSEFIIIF